MGLEKCREGCCVFQSCAGSVDMEKEAFCDEFGTGMLYALEANGAPGYHAPVESVCCTGSVLARPLVRPFCIGESSVSSNSDKQCKSVTKQWKNREVQKNRG